MTERLRFIEVYLNEQVSIAELSRRFGVSRKTGSKWVKRFLEGCEVEDRSRRPVHSPRAVPAWLEDAIVAARKQKPRWGPKKLRRVLANANPHVALPAESTIALIIKRNGLVRPRKKHRTTPPSSSPLGHATHPNAIWCIDFKGHFPVGKTRCYPLTLTDAYSRYLLACVALTRTDTVAVRRVLLRVFDEFGLPDAIRSDNGAPFASTGCRGLSQLSAWWMKLGIRHERIEPAKPQQNGRHERMHLTLKQETAAPPSSSMRAQQRVFDRFRKEYNDERPHEALGLEVPASFYQPSKRPLPTRWTDFDYGEICVETARLSKAGVLRLGNRSLPITAALGGQLVGIRWNEVSRRTEIVFGPLLLGHVQRGPKNSVQFVGEKTAPLSLE